MTVCMQLRLADGHVEPASCFHSQSVAVSHLGDERSSRKVIPGMLDDDPAASYVLQFVVLTPTMNSLQAYSSCRAFWNPRLTSKIPFWRLQRS